MYAQVPDHLRPALIENLKRRRLKSATWQSPVCVLIFSVGLGAVVWNKGHYILELLEDIVGQKVTHAQFVAGLLGLIVLVTAVALAIMMKQDYLDCRCDVYHFCPEGNAVDNYDDGKCHICGKSLIEKASFFYTTDKEEIASLQRIGLPVFKESRHVSVPGARCLMGKGYREVAG